MEHKKGRCHPFMALNCASNGSKACLRCDPPACVPDATTTLPAESGQSPEIPAATCAAPERVAEPADASLVGADTAPKQVAEVGCLTLEELQDKKVWEAKGVDPTTREEYLSDDSFQALFGVSKADFAKLPKWKRDREKKVHDLF